MSDDMRCPKCNSENVYHDGSLWNCPDCSHEWNPDSAGEAQAEQGIKDANGNLLVDGDSVTVIKDLKVKGSSLVVKGHNISCKIDGIGAMGLKSEFVKKA